MVEDDGYSSDGIEFGVASDGEGKKGGINNGITYPLVVFRFRFGGSLNIFDMITDLFLHLFTSY